MLDRVTEIFANVYGPESAEVASPLVTLGRCALERRRPGDAIAAFERALALRQRGTVDPMGVAEVHYRLAEALGQANRRREAVASARRALELLGDAEAAESMRAEVRSWLREHRH
jgi:tetratricopeptide (TPR) repeat protein